MTETAIERAAFAKAAARLLPLLFACYIVAFLDRVNVGFAKLQMAESLRLSDAVYGFGAGIFFIGYFLFEVPSNLILERIGARAWIARIMITWGIVSAAFAFVAEIPWGPLPALFGVPPIEFSFYALRFLLGIAEAGFFPGIILYLTYWFPSARRARTVALFMTAIVVANVIGAPISGAIMQYADGLAGWPGWRWLFILEAAPSVIAGIAVLVWLPNGPSSARWLRADERDAIVARLAADHADAASGNAGSHKHGVRGAFADVRVWALSLVYLAATFALYGVNFWMPTIIQELGIARTEFLQVGLISMIPWGLAGVAMLVTLRPLRSHRRAPLACCECDAAHCQWARAAGCGRPCDTALNDCAVDGDVRRDVMPRYVLVNSDGAPHAVGGRGGNCMDQFGGQPRRTLRPGSYRTRARCNRVVQWCVRIPVVAHGAWSRSASGGDAAVGTLEQRQINHRGHGGHGGLVIASAFTNGLTRMTRTSADCPEPDLAFSLRTQNKNRNVSEDVPSFGAFTEQSALVRVVRVKQLPCASPGYQDDAPVSSVSPVVDLWVLGIRG